MTCHFCQCYSKGNTPSSFEVQTGYHDRDSWCCIISTKNSNSGKPISEQELFRYTNGRFLTDEEFQFSKRYVHFNVEKLCDVITNLSGSRTSPVLKIEKMEGGFSKALLITREGGSQYIAKIPCPCAGRPMYCTASEVAVLKFSKITKPINSNLGANTGKSQ